MSIADKLAVIAENEQKVLDKVTEVADAIREYANLDNRPSLNSMANHVPTVYQNGYDVGYPDGEEKGFVEGKKEGVKDERTQFWDVYLNNGGAANYTYAFAKDRFTDDNYFPNHSIVCMNNTQAGSYLFADAKYLTDTKVGIYITGTRATSCFNGASSLVTIKLLDVNANTQFDSTFKNCSSLKNLTMGGTIGQSIDLSASPLSRASIESVVTCLSDSAIGMTASFSKSAVLNAFGTEAEWAACIASKDNWEITL